ncbi:MAG: amino acid ABC transporter substrate-binding protein [Anaerolineae bacterium]|nr:amino acid ABC transporter substrate-binding protein [Anaerolineae bacterium]
MNAPATVRPRRPHDWQRLNRLAFKTLRRLAAMLACVALVGLLFWRYRQANPRDMAMWRVEQTGVLRVGMDTSYPPFSALGPDGPFGLDVDIAHEIGRRLGVQVAITPMGIDGLYDALRTNQVEALVSALSFDATRIGAVIYTRAYLDAGQILVSRGGIARMEQLDGKSVAVEYGAVGDELARRWLRRLAALDIRHFIEPDEALAAVERGAADAALVDAVSARLYLRAHPDSALQLASATVQPDPYVAAAAPGSRVLAGKINAALEAMAEDGTLAALVGKWL